MAKFYGKIGYVLTTETAPGVWSDGKPIERYYRGDVLQNNRRWETTSSVNDDIKINNRLSIVADPFAYENLYTMKYVEWYGTKWKVSEVDIQPPRIIISLGGVYDG